MGKNLRKNIPPEFRIILNDFSKGLQLILGKKLYGIYVHGALVFDRKIGIGDVDSHVILKNPLNKEERREIKRLHNFLCKKYPVIGEDIDC